MRVIYHFVFFYKFAFSKHTHIPCTYLYKFCIQKQNGIYSWKSLCFESYAFISFILHYITRNLHIYFYISTYFIKCFQNVPHLIKSQFFSYIYISETSLITRKIPLYLLISLNIFEKSPNVLICFFYVWNLISNKYVYIPSYHKKTLYFLTIT